MTTILPGMVVRAQRRLGANLLPAKVGLVVSLSEYSGQGFANLAFLGESTSTSDGRAVFLLGDLEPVTDPAVLTGRAISGRAAADLADLDLCDWEAGDDLAILHVRRQHVTVDDIDDHDAEQLRGVAALFDAVAVNASDLAYELRGMAASLCETCSGYGAVGVDDTREADCPGCGGTGRVE